MRTLPLAIKLADDVVKMIRRAKLNT